MYIEKDDYQFWQKANGVINKIKKKDIKNALSWSLNELSNEKNNVIIYAPNASGKTTLSNIISHGLPHFHTNFVEYVDNHKTPHITLLEKAKKFSYSDLTSFNRIMEANKELKALSQKIKWSQNNYQGSAPICNIDFLKSINNELLKEAIDSFDPKKIGWLPYAEYLQEDYDLRPYIYWGSDFRKSYKLQEELRDVSVELLENEWLGDGEYIQELLKRAQFENTKHAIYSLLILCSKHWEAVSYLIPLDLGILSGEYNTSFKETNIDDALLKELTNELQKNQLIDESTSLTKKNGTMIFSKNNRNITRTIFSALSDGQTNLLSYIFFLVVVLKTQDKIILDDPFDTLDHINSYKVISSIKKYENKKKIIVLTHRVSSLEMMEQYLRSGWSLQYLKNQISLSMPDLENLERKLFYLYINGKNFKDGFILMMRYLTNDSKLNVFVYGNSDRKIVIDFFKQYYFHGAEALKTEKIFHEELLRTYDYLIEIKRFLSWKYNKNDLRKIRVQISTGIFINETKDEILKMYNELYFIINDLSHNNSWGFNLLEILSFKNEFKEMYKLVQKERRINDTLEF